MKKAISMLLLILLILVSFAGCGTPNKKSEADLREEIKKELEAEKAAEKEGNNSKVFKIDMKDMDALYEFVKRDIKDLSREDFNLWEVNYMDITGDGNDEAVLAGVYGVEWPQKMQIISGDTGEYKRIPSDIPLYKYENKPELRDGFFVVTGRTGGTGTESTYMDFYIYNGSEIINVLTNLEVYYRVAGKDIDMEVYGEIDGKLTDFIFTVTEHDNLTKKETIYGKKRYIYNADTKSFDVKPVEGQGSDGNQEPTGQPGENDISEGYTYMVEGGDLKLTYSNTGNTVTLIKANESYDYKMVEGDNVSKDNTKFLKVSSANKSKGDGIRLYFTIEGEPGWYPVTYNMDLNTMEIYRISEGDFVKEIKWDKYTTLVVLGAAWEGKTQYSVYDITGNRAELFCELGEKLDNDIIAQINRALGAKLYQFGNETVNGVQVNYSDCYAVIIPMYSGANLSGLESDSKVIGSPISSYQPMELNFAIFGELKDVVVTYFEGMGSEGKPAKLGTFRDTNVGLTVYGSNNDMTYLKVAGKAYAGEGNYRDVEFTLDAMRDPSDYKVIMFK